MKFGAEPKKIAILGVLLVIAAITLYTQVFSGSSDEPAPRRSLPVVAAPIAQQVLPGSTAASAISSRRRAGLSGGEFHPRVGVANPKDRPDPATIDPQIRFDLLAKLEKVDVESSGRNIFQMGSAVVPIGAQGPLKPLPKTVATIPINHPPATAPPITAPSTPPVPPITFRYYGFEVSKANGHKEAFLLDGDDILIAGENETVKRGRYKVTHIGVNSITIEDTQFKHSQTLQLEEVTG